MIKFLHRIFALAFLVISLVVFTGLVLSAHSLWINPSRLSTLSLLSLSFPFWAVLGIILSILALILKYWPSLIIGILGLLWSFPQMMNYMPLGNSAPGLTEATDKQVRILSYNVGGFYKTDGAWDAITQYIMESGADVVLIQEFNRVGSLTNLMKAYPYHHSGATGNKRAGSHLAIFSKLPIISQKNMDLESDYNGGWSYLLKMGNDTLWVANCHLESNQLRKEDLNSFKKVISSKEVDTLRLYGPGLIRKMSRAARLRAPQARKVDSLMQEQLQRGRSIIVSGDFNDSPQSYAHELLKRSLKDAFISSGHGPGYSYKNGKLRFRIDHILFSKDMVALDCQVDPSISASDHFPIQSTLKKAD